jgi:CheY-like chemotaxis protein
MNSPFSFTTHSGPHQKPAQRLAQAEIGCRPWPFMSSNVPLFPRPAANSACPQGHGAQLLNPLVMVVEDNDDARLMLKVLLEMSRYRVAEASDGLEAIAVALRERPDIILMDGSLPRLDGLTATRRIREQEVLREVPIIVLSGHVTPEFQAAARAVGCTGYLSKPVDFDQLLKLLSQLLSASSNYA